MRTIMLLTVILFAAHFTGRAAAAGESPRPGLRVKEGIRHVVVRGTPREMGRALGALFRDEVRAYITKEWVEPFRRGMGERWPEIERLLARVTLMCPEEAIEECRGIAEACDLPERDVVYASLIGDIVEAEGEARIVEGRHKMAKEAGERKPAESGAPARKGCSNVAVWGQAARDGETYHFHNFDWSKDFGLQNRYVVISYHPTGGLPYTVVGWPGTVYTCSGMNGAGISVGMVGHKGVFSDLDGVPMGLVIKKVLARATRLRDAADLIAATPRTIPVNYVIASGREGAACAVETNSRQVAFFFPGDGREQLADYSVKSECTVCRSDDDFHPDLRNTQTTSGGDFERPGPESPVGSRTHQHYVGMMEFVRRNFGRIDAQIMIDGARDAALKGYNLHSAVFCNSRLEMRLAVARGLVDACRRKYVTFTRDEMFGAAAPPVGNGGRETGNGDEEY
ncbi:MAG: hypothetical protein HY719_03280 [Planctomycetes bacterium]|nr:hypothetical protein [Planctomycetota bacterium]